MAITVEKQEVDKGIQEEELKRLEIKQTIIEGRAPKFLQPNVLHIDTLGLKARIKDFKGITYTWNITKE